MKKIQIKIVNNDVSSNDVAEFLKYIDKQDSKEIKILFNNGNIIKVMSNISSKALNNDLTKKFNVKFETREIE